MRHESSCCCSCIYSLFFLLLLLLLLFFFSERVVSRVYEYAHEYQIPTVLAKAERYIVNVVQNLDLSSFRYTSILDFALDSSAFAEKYDNTRILSTTIDRLARVPYPLYKNKRVYKRLSPHNRIKLLEGRLDLCENNEYFSEDTTECVL